MSSSSSRRLKDRGGSTGKIIPSITPKTLTPISDKKPSLLSVSGRKSIAKETTNPRSVSRVSTTAQKPVLRSMPKVSDAETRSKSRGRSDSPSDFTRILSDMRKSRVSVGESRSEVKGVSGFRDKKGFKDLNQKVGGKSRVSIDGKENKNVVKISGKKEDNLSLVKLNVDNSDKDVSFNDENVNQVVNLKSDISCKMSEFGGSRGLSVKGLDDGKDKGLIEEPMSGRVGSKNKSKLHEKLAYLEGKVKRIASDIKKTKEMLDSNNNDESKMILSDIQAKISGIEKAMGTVMADSSDHLSGGCSSNGRGVEMESVHPRDGENQSVGIESNKAPVKGLSCEELEARLFPHHRLLRSRAVLIEPSSEGTGVGGLNSKEGLKSVDDEDPIAVEFLDSLDKMQPDVVLARTLDGNRVQEADDAETSTGRRVSGVLTGTNDAELDLQADERLEEFDDEQENRPEMMNEEAMDDDSISQLIEIGRKTSTGGWFVSEGESVLLAHDDGSCSFYDIANQEEKAEYRPPAGISENIWRDCWIIRAPSADGCSGKYVVAASAGNTMDSGFCSWDFYSKDVRACHLEDNTGTVNPRVALGRLPDNVLQRRSTQSNMSSENRQWWYRPCGPLIISTASCQRAVKVFDIRDGEQIMKWDVQKPVLTMDYSSPLQWRNRGKAVIAETEAVSLWDVSSLNPRALLTVSTSGRRISALHINNTDAELGGGVRQRASSSEAEGNDGVFCTADSINVLDFRQPSGIGLKIPKIGVTVQSIYSRGDSVYLGCSSVISAVKKQVQSQVLQFSIRKQKIVNTYSVPESNAHSHYKTLTQVWGNSNMVMGVCGLGLYVFDSLKDDGLPSFVSDSSNPHNVKEIIGPDDLYSPSFDCLSSQILLISRDRPAMWKHLS